MVIAVLIVGVLSSMGLSAYLQTTVAREGQELLAEHGELLSDSALTDIGLVADQLRSFRGLFEASQLVTTEEFGLFSRVVGFTRRRLSCSHLWTKETGAARCLGRSSSSSRPDPLA